MKDVNKRRKTNCLNCKHSYRGKDGILHCHNHHTTMVTYYDCIDYVVFMEDKEDLIDMYKIIKKLTKEEEGGGGKG